jgi:hypothetical protein
MDSNRGFAGTVGLDPGQRLPQRRSRSPRMTAIVEARVEPSPAAPSLFNARWRGLKQGLQRPRQRRQGGAPNSIRGQAGSKAAGRCNPFPYIPLSLLLIRPQPFAEIESAVNRIDGVLCGLYDPHKLPPRAADSLLYQPTTRVRRRATKTGMNCQLPPWSRQGEGFGTFTRLIFAIFLRRSSGGALQPFGTGEL